MFRLIANTATTPLRYQVEILHTYIHLTNKKHLKNVGPIRHCEPPHATCSNFALPFTRCRYCRHHYQDEPKPAIAVAQAACDSSDTW